MFRRLTRYLRPAAAYMRPLAALLLAAGVVMSAGCQHKKAANPLSHINSKQPDKVLFDRAMEAMKNRNYEVARLTLQTLINTYPDSEFIARAKLTMGEAWYQEGSTAGLEQAETEFRDFITFFPNMPEAAEAQLKLGDIHYRQMEKPDRDFTHAKRAQEEYRQMLLQYPDSKLADTARLRLLEVQEVLGEREYRIAHYYWVKGSTLAAIARAKTLVDTYPLFSKADDAWFILGQSYETQAERTAASKGSEEIKKRLIKNYEDNAAEAYTKIVTRYPAMDRCKDAKSRLAAMKRPVPEPTAEALAQNKKELNSRVAMTRYEKFVSDMSRRPNVSEATRIGDPNLEDPKETDAPTLAREINGIVRDAEGSHNVAVQPAAGGGEASLENQAAPRTPEATVNPNDLPAKAPDQLNEAAAEGQAGESSSASAASAAPNAKDDTKNASTSQKKKSKKRWLKLPVPF